MTAYRDQHLNAELEALQGLGYPHDGPPIRVGSDMAAVIRRYQLTACYKGHPVERHGLFTTVLTRQGDDWVIAHVHLRRRPENS